MILQIWIAVLIAVIWLYLHRIYSRFSDYGVKHMRVIPLFGNMMKVIFRRVHYTADMERIYHSFPNERFIGRYELLAPTIIIRDLELVKKITVKDFEYFQNHKSFVDENVEPLAARNLFLLQGQEWKDMRSTLSPAFTSSKIKLMMPFMEEAGEQMIRALKEQFAASDTGYIDIDCKDLTSRFGGDVIASCAFGLKVDSHADPNNQFFEMGKEASGLKMRQMLLLFALSAYPSIVKKLNLSLFSKDVTKFFMDIVLTTMKDREARNIIRPDMIHLLMQAKEGKLSYDEKVGNDEQDAGFATVKESSIGRKTVTREWADVDLIAQAVLFFVAGFESVSIATSFALYELAIHPDIQERLVKEIKDEHVRNHGKLDFGSIQKMTYLDMVASEVLRLWPPAIALDRVCSNDYNLGKPNDQVTKDYIVRKGEVVWIPVRCFHLDPKYFANPKIFDPERFSDVNKHNINPLTYIPFGLGPRNCIGSRFALCEFKMLLYKILLHIEVSPSKKTRIPAKISTDSFNPRMEGGHWLRFKLRS
ncbi:unnamed protein product, partial [Brenthis ino]